MQGRELKGIIGLTVGVLAGMPAQEGVGLGFGHKPVQEASEP